MTAPGSAPAGVESVSFVVPVFREEAQIDAAIDAFLACGEALVGSGRAGSFEVVLVDDGSDDATPERLASRSDEPRLVIVSHPVNRGLGAAIRSGIGAAGGSVLVYVDADLPFDLAHVAHGLDLLVSRDADAVSAFRLSRRGEGPRRYVYSYVYNAITRRLFGLHLRDVNFAGKFLRRDALADLDLRSEGSFIDVEILAQLVAAGRRIEQFGVGYQPRTRGVSSLSSPATIRTILAELRALGPGIRRRRRVS